MTGVSQSMTGASQSMTTEAAATGGHHSTEEAEVEGDAAAAGALRTIAGGCMTETHQLARADGSGAGVGVAVRSGASAVKGVGPRFAM
jgi:hypothetical protein